MGSFRVVFVVSVINLPNKQLNKHSSYQWFDNTVTFNARVSTWASTKSYLDTACELSRAHFSMFNVKPLPPFLRSHPTLPAVCTGHPIPGMMTASSIRRQPYADAHFFALLTSFLSPNRAVHQFIRWTHRMFHNSLTDDTRPSRPCCGIHDQIHTPLWSHSHICK